MVFPRMHGTTIFSLWSINHGLGATSQKIRESGSGRSGKEPQWYESAGCPLVWGRFTYWLLVVRRWAFADACETDQHPRGLSSRKEACPQPCRRQQAHKVPEGRRSRECIMQCYWATHMEYCRLNGRAFAVVIWNDYRYSYYENLETSRPPQSQVRAMQPNTYWKPLGL